MGANMKLFSRKNQFYNFTINEPFIAKITENPGIPEGLRSKAVLISDCSIANSGFKAVLLRGGNGKNSETTNSIVIPEELFYLSEGDVIRVNPAKKQISVLYRRSSTNNAFLLTERCNSYCLMCSQPPKITDDSYIAKEVLEAIPLIDRSTNEIGLTGGEPTLLGDDFFKIIHKLKIFLPDTSVHILTNGRNFKNAVIAKRLKDIDHPDLMLGIPIYSPYSEEHDFIVQAKGAFEETIRGILNLKRLEVPVEVRVVIHKANYKSIVALSKYIVRNLTFVDKVAFMGLELKGFTKVNLNDLWIDPFDYQDELEEAIRILETYKIPCHVYNLPLCVTKPSLEKNYVKSISDWKNIYLEECNECFQKSKCGGFFQTSELRVSDHIKALPNN